MTKFEEILDFPEESKRDKKIFKEKIYSNADIQNKDKTLFIEGIQEIRWVYSLKEENIRIFKKVDVNRNYSQIDIFKIILKKELKNCTDLKRIAEITLRVIYNPIILFFKFENKISIFLAHKKRHGTDEKKTVIESTIVSTNWIDLETIDKIDEYLFNCLKLENLKSRDFFDFYDKIINNILLFNASKNIGRLLTPTIEYNSNKLFELSEEYLNTKKIVEKYDKKLDRENNPKKIIKLNELRTLSINRQKELEKILI